MQYVSRHVFVSCLLLAAFAGAVAGGLVTVASSYISTAPMRSSSLPESTAHLTTSSEDQELVAVVKRSLPSVVAIDVRKDVATLRASRHPLMDSPSAPELVTSTQQRIGGGSGFFVSNDGMIVTNRHVVDDTSATYSITTQDGSTYPVTVLDTDSVLDLAILKANVSSTSPLELGDSDTADIGETVLAIGNALAEFQNSVTKGVISGKNRHVIAGGFGGDELIEQAIQTDAAINPGNSGGPLIDAHGNVIGVNTAVSADGQSLGFAIPSNAVKQAIESVKKTGHIIRPWLGVRYFMIDPDMAKADHLPVNHGAVVEQGSSSQDIAVIPGSPADHAGIQENDIITEIEGQEINADLSLSTLLSRYAPGDHIQLTILRKGQKKTLTVILDTRTAHNH